MKANTLTGAGLGTLAMTIVGSSVAVSRLILDYPPLLGQAQRYTVAAIVLFGLSTVGTRPPRRWPPPRDLLILTALAASGLAGFNLAILIALRHTDPAVIGTVIGAAPLALALIGPVQRRERPSGLVLVAAAVIVAGIAIVYGGGHSDRAGLLGALAAFAGEVLFSVLAAMVLPRLGAVRTSAWSCALAVPMLVIGAAVTAERWRPPTLTETLTLGYLAIGLTVIAFLCWFTGLRRLGVERAGLLVGVLPVATLITTAVADGHWPDPVRTLGVAVVAVGLGLGLTRRRSPHWIEGSPASVAATR